MKTRTLYPRNSRAQLNPQLFQNPTAEYRGAPFWSWNCRLDEATLLRQIDVFQRMGFGGFHMHSRVGLATSYLGDEFLRLVRACTAKAKRKRMLAWLYDEDRWPSGAAGGLVTRDPQYRIRHLYFTPWPYGVRPPTPNQATRWQRTETGRLLARYEVIVKDGWLHRYRRLRDGETARGPVWYAYLEQAQPASWYNHPTYLDTLSEKAAAKFVEVTHERFAAAVGREFGRTVPAIFTDEPQFAHRDHLDRPEEQRAVVLPFADDFCDTYALAYGERIEDRLPELIWELPGHAPSRARYRFQEHVTARFAAAFGGVIGRWCAAHGIALTGHMMAEETLANRADFVGEAMRTLAHFQLPGIDLLCDHREFTTAKQAQSVARQYGRPGVLSELYGVTNWDFDFVGHKAQGDWQAALGVTVRVPYLAWVSMAGEAKRDYPAAIDEHSPWHGEYRLVEDHFARLNTVLTRGEPVARVAVLHPIESHWLEAGPRAQTKPRRDDARATRSPCRRGRHGAVCRGTTGVGGRATERPRAPARAALPKRVARPVRRVGGVGRAPRSRSARRGFVAAPDPSGWPTTARVLLQYRAARAAQQRATPLARTVGRDAARHVDRPIAPRAGSP